MKTSWTVSLASLAAVAGLNFFPLAAAAITPSALEGGYSGDFTRTRHTCEEAFLEGTIDITLDDLNVDGTVVAGTVQFSNGTLHDVITGDIFKKDGRRWIYLNYSDEDSTLLIMGRLTKKKKIKAMYDHTEGGCNWGGTVTLSKN